MNTLTRKTVTTLSVSFGLVALVALPATAAQPQALLIQPAPEDCVPEFGFSSFNIRGFGERVTHVRWGGLASRIGLEPGDIILRMNGRRLSYDGAWHDALHHAVDHGGWVHLTIRDVRTGRLVHRDTFVGDNHVVGPVTPKFHAVEHQPPVVHHRHHVGRPVGPITPKAKAGDDHDRDLNRTIKKIARLFD